MKFTPLAFMELFLVLAFAIGWLVLERIARRFDRKRQSDPRQGDVEKDSSGSCSRD
jgi:hypothetical protein